MKNLKVSLKLIFSFLIVVALAVAVGAFGIVGMSRINTADVNMYDNNYLPTVVAGEISQKIVEQRVQMRNFVIYDVNTDSEIFKSAEDSLSASRKDMEELIAEYEKTIADPEDEAAFAEFIKIYNGEWKSTVDSIHTLGVNNKMQEAKEALTAATIVAGELNEISNKLQEVNLADGKKAVDSNTNLFITMTIIECAVLVAAVTIAMILAFYISGLISKPLIVMSDFLNKASQTGDIELRPEDIAVIGKFGQVKDETGQCVSSLSNFVMRIIDVSKALETVADGDLTTELKLLSQKDTMGLSLEKMVSNLNTMFGEIHSSTTQVSTGAKQIADGSQALAQGSTQQAAAVEQLSSSISEIAGKTKENADMAERAATLAGTIKQNAEKGSRQMGQMMEAVKEINQASQSINKVISVIDNIAFQTNILALNAAVEAARAGQHGKGFAVVAEEVRNLASKSAEAANETSALIANSMEKAEFGARIADETAASLVEIVSGINESTQLVGEIARSSDEQSEGITQINKGIDQVAQVVQQNSATAEQSAAASEEMSSQSSLLEDLISQFKLKESGTSSGSLPAARKRTKQLVMPERTSYTPLDNGDYGKY